MKPQPLFFGACFAGFSLLMSTNASSQTTAPAKKAAPSASQKLRQEPTPAKRPAAPANESAASNPKEEKTKSTLVSIVKRAPNSTASTEQFQLRYRLKPNAKIVSEVTHLAKTNTKINDEAQSSQSRSVSRKVWTVSKVDKNGDMTFVYQVDSVEMSQQIGDGEELRYNSATDAEPNAIFQKVAETIGKPIATITINDLGQVIERSDDAVGSNLGMGEISVPLPEEAIDVGTQWETPREIRVRRTDGTPKVVKVRELYTLEKVSAGVAVISIRTEPLTPLTEPEVEAQALQQMSNGTIRFDLDAGKLISKKLEWDKTVVGFSGAGSVMDYSARLDEVVQ
ncbi:MAG: hypothetical protein SGI77_16410 [Pirellulaceae bacterium]|nr:hypothetical protein [Pirellulaceae bacterium]